MPVNQYKIRYVLDFIRRQGKLPKDAYGQILCASDLLAWFRLEECLNREELLYIENELFGMVAAEKALEKLKQTQQHW